MCFHGEYRGKISTFYLQGRRFEVGGYLCPGCSIFDLQIAVVVFTKQLANIQPMQAEIDELNARKAILKAELQKAQRKEQDYAAMRQNVEDFLSPPQPEQERKKNVELE